MTQPSSSLVFEENTAAITTSYVTTGGCDILEVTHQVDPDDGEEIWQFHCGNGDYRPEVLQVVTIGTLLKIDPSLPQVAKLPANWVAKRKAKAAPWLMAPDEAGDV